MILFFHFLCLLAQYIVSNLSKSTSKNKVKSCGTQETVIEQESSLGIDLTYRRSSVKQPIYEDGTLKFFPPVYIQRYETVALVLEELASRGDFHKVVDFGCAELGFFRYLKNMDGINEVLEIDIDEEILQRSSFKAAPLTSDYLMSKSRKPLDVYILAGSVADYDDYLAGTDAVIAIEVIEHLTEQTLNKLPYNIFNQIKPKIAIFTTPNSEFNSLFPNFTDMRHNDHKFEWTRKEFYTWTQEILAQYPDYSVRFFGIGAGPEGTENLGCCTQMALFQRLDEAEEFENARERPEGIHNYKLIQHYSYPVFEDVRTTEEKIIHEIQYQMTHIMAQSTYYNYDENQCEVPLALLQEYVTDFCRNEDELRNVLLNCGMRVIQKEETWYLVQSDSNYNSHESSFEEDCPWNANESISKDEFFNENWDFNEEIIQSEDAINFQSARSIEEFKYADKARIDCNSVQHSYGDNSQLTKDTKPEFDGLVQKVKYFPLSSKDSTFCKKEKTKGPLTCRIPQKGVQNSKVTHSSVFK